MTCLHRLHDAWTADLDISKTSRLDIFLVDDGSTDGTGEAVKEFFVQHSNSNLTLQLIQGTGNLFWAKGMALAWRTAIETGNHYDYYLWLNDDAELKANFFLALQTVVFDLRHSVLVGKCEDGNGIKTYGMDGRWFTGNIVLIPHDVYTKVGIIDGGYSHARADIDYAERVRRAGIDIYETDDFAAICRNESHQRRSGKSFAWRMSMLFKPSYWCLKDLWRFQARYYGRFRALCCCVKLILIAMRPVK